MRVSSIPAFLVAYIMAGPLLPLPSASHLGIARGFPRELQTPLKLRTSPPTQNLFSGSPDTSLTGIDCGLVDLLAARRLLKRSPSSSFFQLSLHTQGGRYALRPLSAIHPFAYAARSLLFEFSFERDARARPPCFYTSCHRSALLQIYSPVPPPEKHLQRPERRLARLNRRLASNVLFKALRYPMVGRCFPGMRQTRSIFFFSVFCLLFFRKSHVFYRRMLIIPSRRRTMKAGKTLLAWSGVTLPPPLALFFFFPFWSKNYHLALYLFPPQ